MVHLLMRFHEDTPVFTGLVFAKGSMASAVAEYRNRAKQGFHYTIEFPVDSSEDYDGSDELAEGVPGVFLVMVNDTREESVFSIHADKEAAGLVVEAKSALRPNWGFRIQEARVLYGYPPEMGDAGNLAVL